MTAILLFVNTLLLTFIIGLIKDFNEKDELILKGINALVKSKNIEEK